MRIFFVTSYFHERASMDHGPFPLIYNIVKKISESEEAMVLSYGWPKYPKMGHIDGIRVIRTPLFPPINYLKTHYWSMGLFGLSRVIRENPDVINSQDIDGVLLFKLLNLFKKKTLKITSLKGSIGGWLEKLPREAMSYKTKMRLAILGYYEKVCVVNSDIIIVPSDFLKNEISRFYDINDDKIIRIHNGVDISMFIPKEMIKKQPVLFFTGGDSYRKGTDVLIKSYITLKRKYKDLVLIISGTKQIDRFLPVLNKNSIRVGGDIILKGKIPYNEMPYYFNLCDIFVMPSYHETFGSAIAEAMACGKPVVAANDTAIPEVVGDCGRLIEPGNVEELTKNISELLADENQRKELGRKARSRIEKYFTLDRVINNYLRLFKELKD